MLAIVAAGIVSGCDNAPAKIETSEVQTQDTQIAQVSTVADVALYEHALDARMDGGHGVGVAISIVDKDTQSFILKGMANPETGQKITNNNLFEIGSITKTFTGVLLADMVLKGELNLDDPVSKYLPDNVTMPSYEGQFITLEHLATHTSALPRMPYNFVPADPSNPFADYTPELMYEFLSSHRLKRPIGESIEYSNLGMGLLGHVMEQRSGLSYEALVTERILEPLGMTNTFMVVPEDKMPIFAIGHNAAKDPANYWDINTLSGAGALRSDIKDMTLYLKANMGLIDTELSGAMALSHKMHFSDSDDDSFIGLAWFTKFMDGETVTWHNGGTGGFRTFMGFDTANNRGVVVLANAQDDPDLIGRAILTQNPESIRPDEIDPDLVFTELELEKFVGEYQLAPTFTIMITRKDTQLFGQATGQDKFQIFPKSELEFFLKVVDASLIFEQGEDGEITGLTLDQGGMMQPATKL